MTHDTSTSDGECITIQYRYQAHARTSTIACVRPTLSTTRKTPDAGSLLLATLVGFIYSKANGDYVPSQ